MDETDIKSERTEFYGFLMEFSRGTTPCREHLIKRYNDKLEKALKKGYVKKCGENSECDPIYAITECGKELRDK